MAIVTVVTQDSFVFCWYYKLASLESLHEQKSLNKSSRIDDVTYIQWRNGISVRKRIIDILRDTRINRRINQRFPKCALR